MTEERMETLEELDARLSGRRRGVNRAHVLNAAAQAVADRPDRYGNPAEFCARTARFWSVIFGIKIEPWQVPLAMNALKMARSMHDPTHIDSWTDQAGYAAIGAEVATNGGE